MVYLLAPFCLAAAMAIGFPLALTIRAYRALPADVPDHFDGYGRPDAFGPRAMIFVMIPAQVVVAGIWVVFLRSWLDGNGGANGVVASGFAANGLLAAIAWMQSQTLKVALGKAERISFPFRVLGIVIAGLVLAVLSGALLH